MKKIMLIGFGAMAQEVVSRLPVTVSVGWVVARPAHHAAIQAHFQDEVEILTDPQQCQATPDLVLECASQQAVQEFGEAILSRGWRLAIISTGALAEAGLHERLQKAVTQHGGELLVLSGAVAGMDGLMAAREGGLESVTYQSNKSPASWKGSPAEQMLDLTQVTEPTVFFEGSAREAAQLFPANANVAATIALMGVGMDKTRVELRVDPNTNKNSHRIHARGGFGELQIEMSGTPLSRNPKTSTLAALSAVQACRRLVEGDLGA